MPKDKHPKYRPDMGEQLKAILAGFNPKPRVCHAKGCRDKSTASYYIPRLKTSHYLCVSCAPKVLAGTLEVLS